LAAVLKEKHLGSSIGKVKANGAIAADQVDVRRDAIDFRGEGDGSSSEMDEVALVQPKIIPPGLLSASMWQAFNERT